MKILILGAHLTGGVGKESGKPFNFPPKAYITAPLESVEGDKYHRKGMGHEPIEVELSDEAYNVLLRHKQMLPCAFDVETTFRKERVNGREMPVTVIQTIQDKKAA